MQPNRNEYIGSSDAAALLGVSPWKTPYAVWEHKVYGITEDFDEQREKILKRGQRFEPMVVDMLAEEQDLWIPRRNIRYVDEEFPFLQCEVDAEEENFDGDIRNVEAKSVAQWSAKEWGEPGSDEIPAYYIAQVQFALMITKRKRAIVAALIGTDDLRIYHVNRDEEIIAHIRDVAVQFWNNNVLARVAPEPKDASDAEKIMAKFSGITVEATDELLATIKRLHGVKQAIKRLEAVEERDADAIKFALAQGLNIGGVQSIDDTAIVDSTGRPLVTWNEQSAKRVNITKLKVEQPDIAAQFTESSSFRVMRIKEKNL